MPFLITNFSCWVLFVMIILFLWKMSTCFYEGFSEFFQSILILFPFSIFATNDFFQIITYLLWLDNIISDSRNKIELWDFFPYEFLGIPRIFSSYSYISPIKRLRNFSRQTKSLSNIHIICSITFKKLLKFKKCILSDKIGLNGL